MIPLEFSEAVWEVAVATIRDWRGDGADEAAMRLAARRLANHVASCLSADPWRQEMLLQEMRAAIELAITETGEPGEDIE